MTVVAERLHWWNSYVVHFVAKFIKINVWKCHFQAYRMQNHNHRPHWVGVWCGVCSLQRVHILPDDYRRSSYLFPFNPGLEKNETFSGIHVLNLYFSAMAGAAWYIIEKKQWNAIVALNNIWKYPYAWSTICLARVSGCNDVGREIRFGLYILQYIIWRPEMNPYWAFHNHTGRWACVQPS